jgi:hypothetical protein
MLLDLPEIVDRNKLYSYLDEMKKKKSQRVEKDTGKDRRNPGKVHVLVFTALASDSSLLEASRQVQYPLSYPNSCATSFDKPTPKEDV